MNPHRCDPHLFQGGGSRGWKREDAGGGRGRTGATIILSTRKRGCAERERTRLLALQGRGREGGGGGEPEYQEAASNQPGQPSGKGAKIDL